MNTIGKYMSILTIGLVAGCANIGKNASQDTLYRNLSEAQNRDVMITRQPNGEGITIMRIGKYDGNGFDIGFDYTDDKPFVIARDYNGDKRFDEVKVSGPKGNNIEDLANVKVLDSLLEKLTGPNAPKPSKQ